MTARMIGELVFLFALIGVTIWLYKAGLDPNGLFSP